MTESNGPIIEPIVVEQTFEASLEAVWSAVTEIGQMKKWYFGAIPEFKPEVGFETLFTVKSGSREFPHRWKVTEVSPLKRLAYSWKYDGYRGDSVVVFELFKHLDSTRLRLTHTVLENFPADIPEFERASGVAGWEFFITKSLKEYLRITY